MVSIETRDAVVKCSFSLVCQEKLWARKRNSALSSFTETKKELENDQSSFLFLRMHASLKQLKVYWLLQL